MWKLIVLALLGLAVYFLFVKNKSAKNEQHRLDKNHRDEVPQKILNPMAYKDHSEVIAWEFQAPNLSVACEYARNNAGVRKQTMDCASLPLADCGSPACLCHFRPIYDSRKKQRRNDEERRTSFRMDASQERRNPDNRRKGQTDWHDKFIK